MVWYSHRRRERATHAGGGHLEGAAALKREPRVKIIQKRAVPLLAAPDDYPRLLLEIKEHNRKNITHVQFRPRLLLMTAPGCSCLLPW